MTEDRPATPRVRRWSKARIRAVAWITGGMTLAASGAALAAAPKPEAGAPQGPRRDGSPRKVIERHVIRRIVIVETPAAAPVVVYRPASQAQAPSQPAPAPAPAPAQSGGS